MELKNDHGFILVGARVYFSGDSAWSCNDIPRATLQVICEV